MKKIIILGIILGFFSCKSQDSLYEEYLVPNGLIYPVPAKNVVAKSGNERIEIAWQNSTDPKVVKARIFWNNYTDSVEIAVNADMNTISRIIGPIEENTYSFMVRTYDNDGNISIPIEVMGTVYGELYISTLTNRILQNTSYNGLDLTLNWFGVGKEDETGISVNYTDIHGANRSMVVDPSETETLIPNFDIDRPISYNTMYKPDSLAIDVFHAETVEMAFEEVIEAVPLVKSAWTILGFSGEHDSGGNAARNVIDGNYGNRWHSPASGNYPHWMALDLGSTSPVSRFSLWPSVFDLQSWQTYDLRIPESFTLWGRLDAPVGNEFSEAAGWIKLGAYTCEARAGEQSFVIANPVPVRYFAFYVPSGMDGTTMMVLGEIDIYANKSMYRPR